MESSVAARMWLSLDEKVAFDIPGWIIVKWLWILLAFVISASNCAALPTINLLGLPATRLKIFLLKDCLFVVHAWDFTACMHTSYTSFTLSPGCAPLDPFTWYNKFRDCRIFRSIGREGCLNPPYARRYKQNSFLPVESVQLHGQREERIIRDFESCLSNVGDMNEMRAYAPLLANVTWPGDHHWKKYPNEVSNWFRTLEWWAIGPGRSGNKKTSLFTCRNQKVALHWSKIGRPVTGRPLAKRDFDKHFSYGIFKKF